MRQAGLSILNTPENRIKLSQIFDIATSKATLSSQIGLTLSERCAELS